MLRMARKPRVEFEGATYHVMCRGNHQEAIFKDEADHERFFDTLAEVSGRNGWLIQKKEKGVSPIKKRGQSYKLMI